MDDTTKEIQKNRTSAFKTFMNKMDDAEKSIYEHGYFTEEDVEKELTEI